MKNQKPEELSALRSLSDSVEIDGALGFDPTILIQLLPMLLSLFQNCPKKPKPTPVPVPPQPAASKATAAGWQKAHETQEFATDHFDTDSHTYSRSVMNRGAKEVMREKKRNGERIGRGDALTVLAANLDEARTGDLEANALAIDSANGV